MFPAHPRCLGDARVFANDMSASHSMFVFVGSLSPGSVSLFVVVLNSEQPRIGSVLENLLRLMEECFGRRFWRHVALVFTRYYTDARSARRRGSKTKDMLRDEFSMALATQFPHSQQERTLAADPFPSPLMQSYLHCSADH